MLAIIDYRSPKDSIDTLSKHVDDILLFKSENITYESISGHPDIFVYQDENNLIIAPNSPDLLIHFLNKHNVKYEVGKKEVGKNLQNSTPYNCLSTNKYLFHKKGFTDEMIIEKNKYKHFVNLPQAYTRCSLTHLKNNTFLTSDKGIEKILFKEGLDSFYFSPEKIKIFDHKHGFIGGTSGITGNKIFFNGNIELHKDGQDLKKSIENLSMEIINLNNDYLYDGGGIFLFENKK